MDTRDCNYRGPDELFNQANQDLGVLELFRNDQTEIQRCYNRVGSLIHRLFQFKLSIQDLSAAQSKNKVHVGSLDLIYGEVRNLGAVAFPWARCLQVELTYAITSDMC